MITVRQVAREIKSPAARALACAIVKALGVDADTPILDIPMHSRRTWSRK
jgi:hypothetical protein